MINPLMPRASVLACLLAAAALPLSAADVFKAANADALNLGSSWADGVAPGPTDVAVWDSRVASASTVALGDVQDWGGLSILDPGGLVTLTGVETLTIGAAGIDLSSATQNLAVASGLAVEAAQSWTIGAGRTLFVGNATARTLTLGAEVLLEGSGTVQFGAGSGATNVNITGAGDLVINGVTFVNWLQAGSSATGRTGNTVLNAGSFVISTGVSMLGSGNLLLNGGAIGSGTGTARTLDNAVQVGGGFRVGGAGFSTGAMTFNGAVDLGGQVRAIETNVLTTFSGVISNGGIEKTGTATLVLNGNANTFTGEVIIRAGGALVVSQEALATASSVSILGGALYAGQNGAGSHRINNLSGVSGTQINTTFTTLGGTNAPRSLAVNQSVDGEFAGTFVEGSSRQLSLVKTGSATLTLSGAGGHTLGTTVSEGTLKIGGSGLLGGPLYSGAIVNDGVLHFDSTASQTLSGPISGVGSLVKSSSGTLTVSGPNTLSGNTFVNQGLLSVEGVDSLAGWDAPSRWSVAAGAAIGFGSGFSEAQVATALATGNMESGASLGFDTTGGNRSWSFALTDTVSGSLGLLKLGQGVLTISGEQAYTGQTLVRAGVLSLTSLGALPGWDVSSRWSVASGAVLAVGGAIGDAQVGVLVDTGNLAAGASIGFDTSDGDRTWSATLSDGSAGSLGLAKVGSGMLRLEGSQLYTGTTRVESGILLVADLASLPGWDAAGRVAVRSGAVLAVGAGVSDTDVATLLAAGGLAPGAVLGFDVAAADRTWASAIAGTQGIAVLDTDPVSSNTLTLSAANTFTGPTLVLSGKLRLSNANALAGSSVTVAGGAVEFDASVVGNAFAFGNLGGTGNLQLVSTAATPSAVALTVGSAGGDAEFSGVISGAGSLIKTGAGTLTLSGSNTYTGSTTVNAGTLVLAGGVVRGGAHAVSAGTLRLTNGTTLSLAPTLSGTGRLQMSGGAVSQSVTVASGQSLVVSSGSNSLPGISLRAGSLLVESGTLTLSGNITSETSDNFILRVSSGATLNAVQLNFNRQAAATNGFVVHGVVNLSSTAFDAFRQSIGAVARTLSGTGVINVAGGYENRNSINNNTTFNVARFNIGGGTTGVGITRSAGTISLGTTTFGVFGQNWNSAAAMVLVNAATGVTFDTLDSVDGTTARTITLSGALSGTGKLNKTGAGTLVLSGTNTFSGGASVAGGTLRFTAASLGSSGAVDINGGALEWASGNAADLSSRLNLGAAGGTLNLGSNNVTFASGLSAAGNLAKSGSGTLTLAAAGSVAGVVSVNAGKLLLGHAAALGSAAVTIGSGGTLTLGFAPGAPAVFANAISGSGNLEIATGNQDELVALSGLAGFTGTLSLVSGYFDNTGYAGSLTYLGGRLSDVSALVGTLVVRGTYGVSAGLPSDVLLDVGGVLDFSGADGSLLSSTIRYAGGSLANATDFIGDVDVQSSGLTLVAGSLGSGTVRLGSGLSAALGAGFANDVRLEGTAALTNDLADYSGTLILGNLASFNLGTNPDFVRPANFRLTAGSRLTGQGVVGDVTVETGGVLAPGNSPGIQTVGGNLSLIGGGNYEFEVLSAVGIGEPLPGTDHDVMAVTGELDLSALSSSRRFVLELLSLLDAENRGALADFDAALEYQFTLIEYGTLDLGTNAGLGANLSSLFTINTAGFIDRNGVEVASGWSVINDGANSALVLTYSAIPEPSTYGLAFGLLALASVAVRRRTRRHGGTTARN